MQLKGWCIAFCALCLSAVDAQDTLYRIELTDKGNPEYSIEQPEAFLSARAVERRQRQGIPVDTIDLPIDRVYLQQIRSAGATIRSMSKWTNTVVVYVPDNASLSKLNQLPFVKMTTVVWKGNLPALYSKFEVETPQEKLSIRSSNDIDYYGNASAQIAVNNGKPLHQAGYKGKGMWIAVIDGGFRNANQISLFNRQQIIGYKNFTHLTGNFFNLSDERHGTSVLSCMLSNQPGTLVGTAPEAEYFLFTSEVGGEEYLVEEDYWMAAIEYADSLGVDVVNTSLGYATFNDHSMDHVQSELDGKSVMISHAAHIASQKGMLLFNAAGNEGDKTWHNISFPSDADGVICVGAVDKDKQLAAFSGRGPAADGRIKPDAMAMGVQCSVVNASGGIEKGNGTSYASPILAGLAACLWQALPGLTNLEIIRLLRENSDRCTHPDADYGYGIPDVYAAYLHETTGIRPVWREQVVYVDSGSHRLHIMPGVASELLKEIILYNGLGQKILCVEDASESIDLTSFSSGVYIVVLQLGDKRYINKIVR